ncbi:MAG: YbjN domain-containing protein [Parachlamydiaceae bacterium]|nr:YbjN domain-containing protein [Parachlamydiaceae bacterium]
MITLTLENVEKYLAEKDIKTSLQKESNQLFCLRKYGGLEYPLFIRVYEQETLLQLLLFFPLSIKPGCECDLARLLHLINKEVDLPGFGTDEAAGVVYYRLMLPSYEKKIQSALISVFLDAQEKICRTFIGSIMAVSQGKATYQAILKQLKS